MNTQNRRPGNEDDHFCPGVENRGSGWPASRAALDDTRVEYKVALQSGAVVIEGSNDLVYAAKTAIREAGFTVQ